MIVKRCKAHSFRKAGLALTVVISTTLAACSSNPKPAPEIVVDQVATPAPAFQVVESPRGPMATLDDVLFDFEEATLRPSARSVVADAADYLREHPDRKALIEGHTDHTGDAPYNQMLSEARANSVRDALLKEGVESWRIETRGLGESQPVADNVSAPGRQANRRVEIFFQSTGI